jgi:hypothetical protein
MKNRRAFFRLTASVSRILCPCLSHLQNSDCIPPQLQRFPQKQNHCNGSSFAAVRCTINRAVTSSERTRPAFTKSQLPFAPFIDNKPACVLVGQAYFREAERSPPRSKHSEDDQGRSPERSLCISSLPLHLCIL